MPLSELKPAERKLRFLRVKRAFRGRRPLSVNLFPERIFQGGYIFVSLSELKPAERKLLSLRGGKKTPIGEDAR